MASITDVAKHAHVGVGTVSRVLSGKGYVAEATKKKVLNSIKELNYVPNELARNLLQNKTNTIAVIVPNLKSRFYTSFIDEVEFLLRKNNYKTLLCNSYGKHSNEEEFLNMLERNLVDGVITLSNLLSNVTYAKIKKPLVSFDSVLSPSIPMVYADHTSGGREAAQILIKSGCKKVLQFRDDVNLKLKNISSDIELTLDDFPYVKRHIEFERCIKEAGIEYVETSIPECHSVSEELQAIEKLYEQFHDADGLMAIDATALLYAQIAQSSGKRIPEDLRIVAYDGTDLLDLFYGRLSYIRQPMKELAQTCVDVLLKQINNEKLDNLRIMVPIEVNDKYN